MEKQNAILGYNPDASLEDRIRYVQSISYLFISLSDMAESLGITKYYLGKWQSEFGFSFKKRKRDARRSNRDPLEKEQIISFISQEKQKGCVICGYNRCTRALQFHHINPKEKLFEISKGSSKLLEEVKSEIEKCILVCSNCHAEIHAGLVSLNSEKISDTLPSGKLHFTFVSD